MSPINHAELEWILDPRTGMRIRKSAIVSYLPASWGSQVWVEGDSEPINTGFDVDTLDQLFNAITVCDE
jgi:hypothetical protein